ncbi:hypothetical protein M8J75_013933 [Diaphorina citri]|nr:hypothetical protein M8J75_013933 [Diaphorina citri]
MGLSKVPGSKNMKVIPPLPNNQDLSCYFVTKHSWKGKYKRIFSIGSQGITTYNPTNLDVTNRWSYADILDVKFIPSQPDFFTLFFVKENSRKDGMKFSTEHRARLMIDVMRQKFASMGRSADNVVKVEGFKHHWSESRNPVILVVTSHSLDQMSSVPGSQSEVLGSYPFNTIEAMHTVSDLQGGFVIVCKPFGRMHLFISPRRDLVLQKIIEHAASHCAIPLELSSQSLSFSDFLENKFGAYGEDRHITSLSEFSVLKFSSKSRTETTSRRLLCLTETCLVERDPQTYNIITVKPLQEIYALIRDVQDSQLFTVEYRNMKTVKYSVSQRDALLATLLDGVRSSGNRDVHVKMKGSDFGKRWGPLSEPVEEEVESLHLKFLYQAPRNREHEEVIDRFNINIPYSGLNHSVTQDGIFAENKEKLILSAIQSLLQKEGDQSESSLSPAELEAQFHTMRRLVACRVGYAAFTSMPSFRDAVGLKVVKALDRENEAISHASVDMLCALMHPMHDESSDLRQEQLNKSCLLSNHKFLDALLNMWIRHVTLGTGALVVSAMLDFLTFALCIPYSETTESKHFDALLLLVARRGRPLFQHFQHPSLSIIKGAGLIMRALIEEGEPETARRLQHLALCEAALPRHLLAALFSGSDRSDTMHRQLSRHLIGLWVTDNEAAHALLSRILPLGLLQFLESDEEVPPDAVEEDVELRDNLKLAVDHATRNQRNPHLVKIERHIKTLEKSLESALQHWSVSLGLDQSLRPGGGASTGSTNHKDRPIVLRKRRERVKASANWKLFYYKFAGNHSLPSLIWNHKTREELREALEKELRAFYADRDNMGAAVISWNHHEFEVVYSSLQDELCIDGYYLRILLESSSQDLGIRSPLTFFNNLYHRFLLTQRIDMKCQCLQAMSIVYNQYSDTIGLFPDIRCVILMLARTQDKLERDRLVIFLDKLLDFKENVKIFLDENGINVLVDLLTLCHLHVSRATHVVQSNVLEAGSGPGLEDEEKEWYYGTSEQSKGPVTFHQIKHLWSTGELNPKTKVWAHGMESWKSLHQVPQLKWTLVAKNSGGVMNETELGCLILSMLTKVTRCYPTRDEDGAVIWPLPKVKRCLSHSTVLPHIVQTLLTFDPALVEQVATLLCEIVVDNALARKLYLTGVFFFILMYTGSNVLPIARFLKLTHTQQAFISDELTSSDLLKRSILGPLLPEAMLYYLENHGPEKFAQIFLGEYDTPEAIWSGDMRRLLIGKIAAHIADFTPRLRGNNRAVYQFCGIPAVRYPQLEQEMFVNIFYLRHLCDTAKFPDWPINQPIMLLKDVLEAWKAEVERKPPEMSVDDAYEALGLTRGSHHEENIVRKAYYKIASQYHPDKNPGGRDIFVRANKAYDFLCSRTCWQNNDPNPNNIVLVLRTQSILFHRYSEELSGYKYAGYRQLITTIRAETSDENEALFGGSTEHDSLLQAAVELAYHTVQCSALNAQELNNEGGFQTLHVAFTRCMSVLSNSLKGNEMPVLVCSYVVKCYTVAAQFTGCRSTFTAMCPSLLRDLAAILRFPRLARLAADTAQCLGSLAIDGSLRDAMLDTSVVWSLLTFMFSYDYTLEECEVERDPDQNQQELNNTLAKLSVKACSRLAGTPEAPSPCMQLFSSLLTPYLARELVNDNAEQLLKLLTSNVRTPTLLWNNTTRAQLREILETNLKANSSGRVTLSVQYASHASELIVGGVFVRVYNEMPSFAIEDSKTFVLDLLLYLKNMGDPSVCDSSTLDNMISVLTALNNVIVNNTGLELQCIGHFSTFFPLLLSPPLQPSSLRLLATVSRSQEVIGDMAATPGLLSHLLLTLHATSGDVANVEVLLEALMSLVSHATTVKEMLAKGGYLFLLDLLCNSSQYQLRVRAAELLARLCNDKLSGPRVKLALDHFLPPTLTDSLREAPASSIGLFDSEQENPELLWNQNQRVQLMSNVRVMCQQLYQSIRANPLAQTTPLPPPPPIMNTREIIVGGVYLRLFALNTGWNLRKPKHFLSGLLDEGLRVMGATPLDTPLLDLISKCLLGLLQAQPNLIDLVPSLGHIPRLCCQLSSSPLPVSKSIVATLHILSLSEACVGSMSQVDCIGPIKYVLTSHQSLLSLTAETLARIFAAKKDKIVKQAIDADLISTLLNLLSGQGGLESCDNASTVKAHIVKALKSMAQSAMYGGFVSATLDKSSVWSAYKSQNHDLFIGSSQSNAYLTGVPATAGYLTQGNTSMPSSPPPLLPKPPSSHDLLS